MKTKKSGHAEGSSTRRRLGEHIYVTKTKWHKKELSLGLHIFGVMWYVVCGVWERNQKWANGALVQSPSLLLNPFWEGKCIIYHNWIQLGCFVWKLEFKPKFCRAPLKAFALVDLSSVFVGFWLREERWGRRDMRLFANLGFFVRIGKKI